MNNFDYKNMTPFKWFVLENFPFIENAFEAIDNYRLFSKVVEYLNKTIDNMNLTGEQMENVTNAMIELKNYVNNYFDNLDVQEEINNKLDEMVEDGTFQRLINGIIVTYNSLLTKRNLHTHKIFSTGFENHRHQGFTHDNGYFYIFHHESDAGPHYISQYARDTFNLIRTIQLDINEYCHGNCMVEYNGYLYLTRHQNNINGVMGSNEVYKISTTDWTISKIKTNTPIWCYFLYPIVAEKGTFPLYCYGISGTDTFQIGTLEENTGIGNTYRNIRPSLDLHSTKQGGCNTSTFIYQLGSGYKSVYPSVIDCIAYNGETKMEFILTDIDNENVEVEDITHIKGQLNFYILCDNGDVLETEYYQDFLNTFNTSILADYNHCINKIFQRDWVNKTNVTYATAGDGKTRVSIPTKLICSPLTRGSSASTFRIARANFLSHNVDFTANTTSGTLSADISHIGADFICILLVNYSYDNTNKEYNLSTCRCVICKNNQWNFYDGVQNVLNSWVQNGIVYNNEIEAIFDFEGVRPTSSYFEV